MAYEPDFCVLMGTEEYGWPGFRLNVRSTTSFIS